MPSSTSVIQGSVARSPIRGAAARLGTLLLLLALMVTAIWPRIGLASGNSPVAADQAESTREAKVLWLFLDAWDDEFDPLAFTITDPPDNGTLDDCSSGTCTYTPNTGSPNFVGTDSFQWKANDGTSDSNEATFTITVVSNSLPVANDGSTTTREAKDAWVFLDYSDDDFDPLTFTITDAPDNGTLDDCSSGACTYTPNTASANFIGTDSFQWKATDDFGDSNTATFTITVTANAAPTASDSSAASHGQSLNVYLDAADVDNDPLTYTILTQPSNGTLSGSTCGGLHGSFCTYTPDAGFVGTDSFTFDAADDLGATSSTATVTIDITANTPPTATDRSLFVFTDTATGVTLQATDADSDVLSYSIVDAPDHGALSDCTSGMCTYTPAAGYTGPDSLTWKANDGLADSNVATMTITVGDPIGRVLILETTVNGGAGSPEGQRATSLGFAVDLASEAQWASMTAAQFGAYRALIVGDTGSNPSSAYATLDTTTSTWGPGVDGNVILIGTDPTDHAFSGGQGVIDNGIAFAVDEAGATGLYMTFSDTFSGAVSGDPVPGTSTLSSAGSFTFGDVGGCLESAHIVAAHPALVGLTDVTLSNWGCSVHNTFGTWPTDFLVLVIATDGSGYTANDGTTGTPYILARGDDLVVISDIGLTPLSATNPVGTSHTLTAAVSNTSGPIVGTTVTFSVTDGPHAGTTGTGTTDSTGTATFSYTGTTIGTDTIKATFVDSESKTQTSNLVTKSWEQGSNTPPSVDAGGPYAGNEGAAVGLDGTVSDADAADTLTTTWTYAAAGGVDAGATCAFGSASAVDTSVTCTDDGSYTLTLTANDGVNSDVLDTATLTVANVDPTVDITTPADAAIFGVGRTVNLSAVIGDAGANDTHTCSIDWGDGTTTTGSIEAGVCSSSHAYAAIGVYTIAVTVTDDDAATGTDEIMVVVSDRTTKLTGGGFIVDGGRTSFGFVAKEDAAGLHGQIQVRAPGGDRFHGSTVTTLASSANSGSWTGTGRWNGVDGYTFEVTVIDNRAGGKKKAASADTISIVIRDGGGIVVFESSGPLMGGNITVH